MTFIEAQEVALRISGGDLARLLFNALFLLVGLALYAVGVLSNHPTAIATASKDFGLAIASASMIFFIFSWITERSQVAMTERVVGTFLDTAVRDIFKRIGLRLMANVWTDYRFNCRLTRSTGPQDKYPRYAVQQLSFQYSHPRMPPMLRLVIGWSNDGDAAKPYYVDPQCLAVWDMSWVPDQPLDLDCPDSHAVDYVEVDGQRLQNISVDRHANMKGGAAFSYEYEVPDRYVGQRANLSFGFFVRKIASTDGAMNIITRLREDCDDVEFTLDIDETIGCKEIYIYTNEVTPLLEAYGTESAAVSALGSRPSRAWARFRKVIQKGSNIRFEVRA